MHPATIFILFITATALFIVAKKRFFPNNDTLALACPECAAITRVTGAICEGCHTRERILLRSGAPKGEKRPMHILLYHCECSSRMHFCDLKCHACGAKISHDRRTEMRPITDYTGPRRRAEDRQSPAPILAFTPSTGDASASARS